MAANNQQGSAPPTSPPASSRASSRTRTPFSEPMTSCSDIALVKMGARFDNDSRDIAAPEHGIEVPARVAKRHAEYTARLSQPSGADANAEQVAGSDTASVHTTRQGASTVSLRTTTPSSSEAGDVAAAETPMPSSSAVELPNRSKPNPNSTDNKRKSSASETDNDALHKKTTPTKPRFD